MAKKSELCQAEPQIVSKPCYKTKGRPADGDAPDYYVSIAIQPGNQDAARLRLDLAQKHASTR